MHNLAELQRRKAELKAQIEQQRNDIKKTILEIREEVDPANLLKKAVGGLFSVSKNAKDGTATGISARLPATLSIIADLLIKDPRLSILVKLLTPFALKFIPKLNKKKKKDKASEQVPAALDQEAQVGALEVSKPVSDKKTPVKARIYSGLRQNISEFRSRLKKKEKAQTPVASNETENPVEPTEN